MATLNKMLTLAAALAAASAVITAPANAGNGKDVFVQDYKFKKPLHGYSGHAGNYYCDYQRIPERRCVVVGGVDKCKIVGWTLREMCH